MRGHIAKKGDRYYIVVYIDGKQKWFSVPDPRPGKIANSKDAEKYCTELLYKINNNTYVDSKNMIFKDLLNKWLESRDLAPKTYRRYKEIIDLHLTPALGNIKLNKLQPLHIQDYYTQALKSGRIGIKYSSRPGLSGTTVLQHHRIIHCALHQAVMWELVSRNVADAVVSPKKDRQIRFDPSLNLIFEVLDKTKKETIHMPIVMALATGARRGEIMGIRWKDYNVKTGKLSIIQEVQRVKGEGLKFLVPKTPGSRRQVELPKGAAEELKEHRARQDQYKVSLGDTYRNHDLICCWNDGRPIDPDYVTKRFEKITADMGYSEFRFHDLRHAHATYLLADGIDAKTIQDRLGHSTVAFTLDQYVQATPSMQHKAAVKANKIFFRNKLEKKRKYRICRKYQHDHLH